MDFKLGGFLIRLVRPTNCIQSANIKSYRTTHNVLYIYINTQCSYNTKK